MENTYKDISVFLYNDSQFVYHCLVDGVSGDAATLSLTTDSIWGLYPKFVLTELQITDSNWCVAMGEIRGSTGVRNSMKMKVGPEVIDNIERILFLTKTLEDLGFSIAGSVLNKHNKWKIFLLVGQPIRRFLTYVDGGDMVSNIEMMLDQAEEEGWGISVTDLKLIRGKLSSIKSTGEV